MDCKRKFPWYTTHGFPGQLRAKALDIIETNAMNEKNINQLTDTMHKNIRKELMHDPQQNAVKAILVWKKITS